MAKTYQSRRYVFHQGDESREWYQATDGMFLVEKLIEGQMRIVQLLVPGDVFGLEYLTGHERQTSVRALAVSQLEAYEREELLKRGRAKEVFGNLAKQYQELEARRGICANMPVSDRLEYLNQRFSPYFDLLPKNVKAALSTCTYQHL